MNQIEIDRALRQQDWRPRYRPNPAVVLDGKTALVLGYGAIGQRVAHLCRGLGMDVIATRRRACDTSSVAVHPPEALHSLLPVITPKEREIAEDWDKDWMWRVHHVQCPDPGGRVVFKIDRMGKIRKGIGSPGNEEPGKRASAVSVSAEEQGAEGRLRSLRVMVDEVRGTCTSGMRPGDFFILRSGRLYIPAGRHFCLYALHAALPFLPAKQRKLEDGDWMKGDFRVICPDPAGNVVMRVEYLG